MAPVLGDAAARWADHDDDCDARGVGIRARRRHPRTGPKTFNDPNFDNLQTEYHDTQAVFAVPVRARAGVTPGAQTLTIAARFQACNDNTCTLPRTVTMTAPIAVSQAAAAPAQATRGASSATAPAPAPGGVAAPSNLRQTDPQASAPGNAPVIGACTGTGTGFAGARGIGAGGAPRRRGGHSPHRNWSRWGGLATRRAWARVGSGQQDLPGFLRLAILMGALSLLTPCVFPMIPVTVSYFTNHASGSRLGAVRLATIYALGIVLTFTVLGVALALIAGAAGLDRFAANPSGQPRHRGPVHRLRDEPVRLVDQAPQALTNRLNTSARARSTIPRRARCHRRRVHADLVHLHVALPRHAARARRAGRVDVAGHGCWRSRRCSRWPFFVLASPRNWCRSCRRPAAGCRR